MAHTHIWNHATDFGDERGETGPAPLTGERFCILLAEDDRINQQVIGRQLDLLGHDIELADLGKSALTRWREGGIDLLLLDMALPDLDGWKVARTMRLVEGAKGWRRTPIVSLSAAGTPVQPPLASVNDIEASLTLPVSVKAMQAALARCLPAGRKASEVSGPPRDTGPPDVDWSVLHRMVGDDPTIVREILGEFLTSAREQARQLRRAYRKGDVRLVGAMAHKLKSASLSIGALALGELCAEMELPAPSNFGTAELEHVRFDRVFNRAITHIESHLQRTPR
jgi:two-component system, sensor histidine kinase and response regulator